MRRFAPPLAGLLLGMLSVAGCAHQATSDAVSETTVGIADALAIARTEHEARNPLGDALFEESTLVELVTLPGSEQPVFKATFITTIEGAAPTERHYFVDADDGTILNVP